MHLTSRLLAFTLLVTTTGSAEAEQFFFRDGPAAGNPTAIHKKSLEREIIFLIDDMKRNCDLSETQVRSLQTAGKGAIVSAMEKFEKKQKEMQQAMQRAGANLPGFAIEEEEDADEGAEENEEEAEDLPPAPLPVPAIRAFNIGGVAPNRFNRGRATGSVTSEPRWTKALASIVTKEQRAKYTKAVKDREAFIRKTAVAGFVAKVDRKLLLSAEQRTRLATLVDEEFGQKLMSKVGQQGGSFVFFQNDAQRAQTPPIDHTELKSLFSEAQFGEWKQTFEQELNQMKGRQMGGGAAFGNVIINGGAAPGVIQIQRAVPARPPANEDKDQ